MCPPVSRLRQFIMLAMTGGLLPNDGGGKKIFIKDY